VCLGESGGETLSVGKNIGDGYANRDLGLWQISNRWHGARLQQFRWRDPYDQAQMMRQIFEGRGRTFDAWHVWTNGTWERHLAAAQLGVAHPWMPPYPPAAGLSGGEENL